MEANMTDLPQTMFPCQRVNGVPVVATPEEVDITNADALRAALLECAEQAQGTLVVDMSRTVFCDTAGLHALVVAHKRAQAQGGELRLVIPGVTVQRILAITGLDQAILNYASLEEALR